MAFIQENLVLVVSALSAICLLVFVLALQLTVRINRLLRGKNAKTLEDTIVRTEERVEALEKRKIEVENYLKSVESRLQKSVQGIETIRFNPFKGTGDGGNQSFATSIISEKGDGVILSSLYTRDRVSVFAKPVKNFVAEFGLTEEEKESLQKARGLVTDKSK